MYFFKHKLPTQLSNEIIESIFFFFCKEISFFAWNDHFKLHRTSYCRDIFSDFLKTLLNQTLWFCCALVIQDFLGENWSWSFTLTHHEFNFKS